MRTCSNCQARNSAQTTFCIRCGAALSDAGRDPTAHTDAFPVQPEDVPDRLVDQAAAQLADGQAAAAAGNCCRAIALNPRHVEAHVVLGMALEQQGDVQGALQAYETVLSLSPDRPVERQKVALLRLRVGAPVPGAQPVIAAAPARRPAGTRPAFSLAACWEWLQQTVTEKPALSAGVGAGLLMFVLLSVLLVSNSRAQAREAMRAQYEQELVLARQATNDGRYAEATDHYAAAWKLRPGDPAVRGEWAQAYQSSQYYAQQYAREMEIASLPKYVGNVTGRNPFDPVPIAPQAAVAAVPPGAAPMAPPAYSPPATVNPGTYEEVKAPPRITPPPTTAPDRGRGHYPTGTNPIGPVATKAPDKPGPLAPTSTVASGPKSEITIWVTPKPTAKPAAAPPSAASGNDAASLRSQGEELGRQGRTAEAISTLERAAGGYDDMARQDPNNATTYNQAAGSCRARIEVLRQNR